MSVFAARDLFPHFLDQRFPFVNSNQQYLIKNLKSDRHIAQKKFNEILQTCRQSILPKVVEEWDILDEDEKSKVTRMNYFSVAYIILQDLLTKLRRL
jgi:hypothetical protein